jgi:hypothetical protein
MKNIKLIENRSGETFPFAGVTVAPGNFFGLAETEKGTFPAFWSGWISANRIALYILDGEEKPQPIWVDGEDVETWSVETDRDFEAEYAEKYAEWADDDYYGYGPCEGDIVPWFAKEATA